MGLAATEKNVRVMQWQTMFQPLPNGASESPDAVSLCRYWAAAQSRDQHCGSPVDSGLVVHGKEIRQQRVEMAGQVWHWRPRSRPVTFLPQLWYRRTGRRDRVSGMIPAASMNQGFGWREIHRDTLKSGNGTTPETQRAFYEEDVFENRAFGRGDGGHDRRFRRSVAGAAGTGQWLVQGLFEAGR